MEDQFFFISTALNSQQNKTFFPFQREETYLWLLPSIATCSQYSLRGLNPLSGSTLVIWSSSLPAGLQLPNHKDNYPLTSCMWIWALVGLSTFILPNCYFLKVNLEILVKLSIFFHCVDVQQHFLYDKLCTQFHTKYKIKFIASYHSRMCGDWKEERSSGCEPTDSTSDLNGISPKMFANHWL